MRELPAANRSIDLALELGPRLLERASRAAEAWIAASVVTGPVVVLGAAQRLASVLDVDALSGLRVVRRATTGTAAYIRARGIVWTLALPHVTFLAPDAEPRTLLNRNVRPFLRGLGGASSPAHYFGREWISIAHRPAALLGYETSPEGAVLLEVLGGYDDPIALPEPILSDDERDIDRWLGKSPVALSEIHPTRSPLEIAARVAAELSPAQVGSSPPVEPAAEPRDVVHPDDPIPPGFTRGPRRRVPIGWIETAFDPSARTLWLGGDVLAPACVRERVASAVARGERPAPDGPCDGCRLDELVAAAELALKLA